MARSAEADQRRHGVEHRREVVAAARLRTRGPGRRTGMWDSRSPATSTLKVRPRAAARSAAAATGRSAARTVDAAIGGRLSAPTSIGSGGRPTGRRRWRCGCGRHRVGDGRRGGRRGRKGRIDRSTRGPIELQRATLGTSSGAQAINAADAATRSGEPSRHDGAPIGEATDARLARDARISRRPSRYRRGHAALPAAVILGVRAAGVPVVRGRRRAPAAIRPWSPSTPVSVVTSVATAPPSAERPATARAAGGPMAPTTSAPTTTVAGADDDPAAGSGLRRPTSGVRGGRRSPGC